MQYYWKIWLWENGKKSTEYTDYLIAPFFHEGCLNQTINTAEVVLDCMPIETKKAFPPKTKFRVERYTTKDYSDEPKIFDLMVQEDNVEEYVSCPEICCHRIEMISPSVVAQGMHTDNMSLTYELQDATLNYKTTKSDNKTIQDVGGLNPINGGHSQALRQTDSFSWVSAPSIGGGTGVI